MVSSLELSIVDWSKYIALKLFLRIWEGDIREGLQFHTFLKIFYKNFKMLMLRYNPSHFMPIFRNIDKKLAQM